MKRHNTFKPNAVHMMTDLETLSLEQQLAPIVAIAFVPFTMEKGAILDGVKSFMVTPHEQSRMDFETIKWWLFQDKAAIAASFSEDGNDEIELKVALEALSKTYSDFFCETLWAKSLQFDINNIEFYMDGFGIDKPWSFRDRMDTRPLGRLLTEETANDIYNKYTLHDPVQDCLCQIEFVRTAVNRS